MSRLGRAVTWTIALFVASVIGWPILAFMLIPTVDGVIITNSVETVKRSISEVVQVSLASGSPFYNTAMPPMLFQAEILTPVSIAEGTVIGSVVWTIGYALIATGLYLAVLMTFDRCLGRSPEAPRRPGREPSPGAVKGWGWRTRGVAGRPVAGVLSFAPPPR